MNNQEIENGVKMILKAIGERVDREGIKETPKRVAKMFNEVFENIEVSNTAIAEKFSKSFSIESDSCSKVTMNDIECFSFCEHHMALMHLRVNVTYIPKDKVIGLSKIPRIVDAVCKRLQLQEKIGSDICDVIHKATGSDKIKVEIFGHHSCVEARGIKKPCETHTLTYFNNEKFD